MKTSNWTALIANSYKSDERSYVTSLRKQKYLSGISSTMNTYIYGGKKREMRFRVVCSQASSLDAIKTIINQKDFWLVRRFFHCLSNAKDLDAFSSQRNCYIPSLTLNEAIRQIGEGRIERILTVCLFQTSVDPLTNNLQSRGWFWHCIDLPILETNFEGTELIRNFQHFIWSQYIHFKIFKTYRFRQPSKVFQPCEDQKHIW